MLIFIVSEHKIKPEMFQNESKTTPKRVPERVQKIDMFWERLWHLPGGLLVPFWIQCCDHVWYSLN